MKTGEMISSVCIGIGVCHYYLCVTVISDGLIMYGPNQCQHPPPIIDERREYHHPNITQHSLGD